MACRTNTSSSSLGHIGSISRTQTTDNDDFCSRKVGLHDHGESDSTSKMSSPKFPQVFNFKSMGYNRGTASDRLDRIIPSPIQPVGSTSSTDLNFEAKRGSQTTGKWTRSRSAEELTPSKMHDSDITSLHSSSLDDLSLMLSDRTWSTGRLRVRTRKPSSEKFQTPAPKRFTRVTTQEIADGTPASDHSGSRSLYWDEKTEDSGYGSPACPDVLFPELPYKMGRGQMDIISAINEREPAIVDKILVYMTVEDIIRFSGVCKEWRRIIEGNRRTALQKRRFIHHKQKFSKKENYGRQNHQRNTVTASTPLREVQRVGLPLAASTPGPSTITSDNYDKFVKASDSLFADESLIMCVRGDCRSPAKLLMNNQRATCSKCGYDFCTSCLGEFHGGSPCTSLRRKNTSKKSHGVGSSKSKRSLKRIARLESYP